MARFTAKQKAFIDHYIITLNGTEAARRAKYKGDDNTLGVVAYDNLRKPKIRAEIDRRLRESAMSSAEVLHRLGEQARGTLLHFVTFHGDGTFEVDLDKARRAGVMHLAKEIRQDKKTFTYDDGTTETTIKTTVKIHDAQGALDKLMRYYGMYNDKVVHVWQQEIVHLLQTGEVDPDEVREELPDLADELFRKAGVNVG